MKWSISTFARAQGRSRPLPDTRRRRDAGDHQPHRHRRRSSRPALDSRVIEETAPRGGQGHRIRAVWLSLAQRQGRNPAARAVGRYCAGRRRRGQQGRGRRRPGHHVRLCLQRDAATDAGAALLRRTTFSKQLSRGATLRRGAGLGPDAKSQVTVRYENGKPVEATQIVVSHQHTTKSLSSEDVARSCAPMSKALPAGWITPQHGLAYQPDRQVLHRRPGRRLRPDRAQDHRRHLRRRGARTAAAPSPARTRPRSTVRRPMPPAIWPRTSSPPASPTVARSSCPMRSASPGRSRSTSISTAPGKSTKRRLETALMEVDEPFTARHSRASRPQSADLCAHLRLWPFRPSSRGRWRLLMGKDRSGRPVARPRLLIDSPAEAARQAGAGEPARRALYGRCSRQEAARLSRVH